MDEQTRGTGRTYGSVLLALGGGVRGGRMLGRWPGLDASQRFEGRDLAVTTDLRDVLAESLREHLGLCDTAAVFPGYAVDRACAPGLFARV